MDLAQELADLVAQIPHGRVSTFADFAEALGDARAAMAVFRILRDRDVEGRHRIVRVSGEVPWAGAGARLRREGLAVSQGRVENLEQVRFQEFQGPRTLAVLREEQRRLATRVEHADRFASAERIAGFDVSYDGDDATAAVVVMDPDGEHVLQELSLQVRIDFPYIPGYLAYREFPAIERCYRRLVPEPDVLLIDGHGILHPARFGIASYAGVALDTPSIGAAKSLLVGEAGPVPKKAGGTTEIRIGGEVLGAGLRSGASRRLIYVSTGHAVSLETAVRITKRLCRTRIPEPLRRADRLAKTVKRNMKKKR